MRYLLLVIVNIISLNLYPQHVDIVYSNYYDSSIPIKRDSRLVINKVEHKAFYQEIFSSTKNIDNDKDDQLETTVGRAKREMDMFIVTDNSCKRIIYDDFVLKKYTIQDDFAIFDWQISEESKMIENFKAYKAITTFRGRKWIAWFTPDIPFPFGPWKFCGLPGLILEVYDESKIFNFNAISINLNSNQNIKMPDSKRFKHLRIKDFVELKDDFYNNIMQGVGGDDRNVTVKREMNLRSGIESKFEWE